MRRTLAIAAACIVGLALLWFVFRRRAGLFGAPSSTISRDGNGKPQPTPLVDPRTLPPPTSTVNVAADVPNGDTMALDFMTDDVRFANEHAMWTDFMQPAGRVRLFADITTDDWRRMFGLLSMTLSRQDGRSRRWQMFNANEYDQQVGQAVDSIVGGIVSAIAGAVGGPVVKILLQYAINTQVAELGQAIAVEQATQDFVDKLRVNANPNKLPPNVLIILSGIITGHVNERGTILYDTPHDIAQAMNMPPSVEEAIGFEVPFDHAPTLPWHKPDGSTYYFPSTWFILTNLGLFLPWVSAELIGPDYQATVNLRARVARCLDAFACMVSPLHPPSAYSGRYFYRNKVYGDILGSFFPPTSEDSHYVDENGVVYGFDGKVLDIGAVVAAGHTAFNPSAPPAINQPGIVPPADSPQAAARGDGCEFCPPPPQLNIALTVPPPATPPASLGNVALSQPPSTSTLNDPDLAALSIKAHRAM